MVRNAAFFTPFRGWRGVPYSERPPSISGVKSSGGASLVMENVVCKGLWRCVEATSTDHVTIADNLFVDNYEAIILAGGASSMITRSVFFSNVRGAHLSYLSCWSCPVIHVDLCLFLQNDVGIYDRGYYHVQVTRTTLAQNEQAVQYGRYASYNDMLFYKNDIAFYKSRSALGNTTFLENRIDMEIDSESDGALNSINFLGVENEYHIHYTGTSLLDFDASFAFWNATSVNEIEEHIYDARDGSGKGLVRILAAESMPQTPFRHGMYQADSCAGQCGQSWFNTNWSSLISAGTGSFSFFDADRSLHSGQELRDALLTGYEAPSGMSLSSYMQDLADLLGAVSNFQTVGTSTSPLPSTTSPTTTTTTTTTTTLAEHLVVGADIIMLDPVWIAENTTWTSADGIRALAARVEILPGTSLRIEGSGNSSLVLALDDCGSLWFNVAALLLLSVSQ